MALNSNFDIRNRLSSPKSVGIEVLQPYVEFYKKYIILQSRPVAAILNSAISQLATMKFWKHLRVFSYSGDPWPEKIGFARKVWIVNGTYSRAQDYIQIYKR